MKQKRRTEQKPRTPVFEEFNEREKTGNVAPKGAEKNLKILGAIGLLSVLLVLGKSAVLFAKEGIFRNRIERTSTRIQMKFAPRGIIFDRTGEKLVRNVPVTDLVLYPNQAVASPETLAAEINKIFPERSAEEWAKAIAEGMASRGKAVLLSADIPHEKMIAVMAAAERLAGIAVENRATREYLAHPSLSHVLGYIGRISAEESEANPDYLLTEMLGKSGLEKVYEREMRGTHGVRKIEVDSAGVLIKDSGITDAVPGKNLLLSIDEKLQEKAAEVLERHAKEAGADKAAFAAIEPATGRVLAMVSYPWFDNNLMSRGLKQEDADKLFGDPRLPLLNRCVQGEYPPGSVFKLAVAAGALEAGVVGKNESFQSRGGIRIGEWFFPDWKAGGHGSTDLTKAIAESVNTYFYTIGGGFEGKRGLGIEGIREWSEKFGYGAKTGIDLTGERTGFLPDEEWKEKAKNEPWYIGDTYHASIGQGDILVTPLQVAELTATIANGGVRMSPRLASAYARDDGTEIMALPGGEEKRVMGAATAAAVAEGMRAGVTSGSSRALEALPVAAAGKTGTAQVGAGDETHAWFTGYAPYEKPSIAIAVLIEKGGGGDKVAVPAAKEILAWYFGPKVSEDIDNAQNAP